MIYADIAHSKELKDLFPDAEWWWNRSKDAKCKDFSVDRLPPNKGYDGHYNIERYPALTTDMLLEILPEKLDQKPDYAKKRLCIDKIGKDYRVLYYEIGVSFVDKTLPNALSLMVKYLRDNGLLKEE